LGAAVSAIRKHCVWPQVTNIAGNIVDMQGFVQAPYNHLHQKSLIETAAQKNVSGGFATHKAG